MKLLFCPRCQDIRKLGDEREVKCRCGKSGGWYKADGLHAVLTGEAVPIGFANSSFVQALLKRPLAGSGYSFQAFVIPVECETIERE